MTIGPATILDINPTARTESECKRILAALLASLSKTIGFEFHATHWFVLEERPLDGHVDVRATANPLLSIELCGVISLSVNPGEFASCICDLLVFADNNRLTSPTGKDLIRLEYTHNGWGNRGWIVDANCEWQSSTDTFSWTDYTE